jgi:oligopeptide transport system ATP-binding protein
MTTNKLIKIEDLKVFYDTSSSLFNNKKLYVKAVNDVSLNIYEKETLGLVGESGCGKSTLGRAILGLRQLHQGSINFFENGEIINEKEYKKFNKKNNQIIFQDPFSSLNPRMSVGDIVKEPLDIHTKLKSIEKTDRVKKLFQMVGLDASLIHRYPHEFSGGQRQRIGIARALAVSPKFIVCDEPISALDVSIQAQIIKLLKKLQLELGLTLLFISHDLSVVWYIADRIAVMYLGKIVEVGAKKDIFHNPKHPYTKALLSSIPVPDPLEERKRTKIILEGDVPNPANPPEGCVFSTRCPNYETDCSLSEPILSSNNKKHLVACHLINQL